MRFGLGLMELSVAIVEDDFRYRSLLAHVVLSAPDMRLLGVADDLPSGRRLLDAEDPDVLLVDLDLPSGSGMALIRHAAQRLPDCNVMVITVFGDEGHVIAAIESGATGYLLKDACNVELAEQIRAIHAGGSPISPVIARQLLKRLAPCPVGEEMPKPSSATPPAQLSAQEHKVLLLTSRGHTYDEIAQALGISRQTVLTYVKRTYRKLHVHNKMGAVHEASRLGWLDT